METVRDYTVHIDNNKRVTLTLRGTVCPSYTVKEYDNGRIVLEPQRTSASISKRTLESMDTAIENLKKGNVSGVIDLSDF